MAENKVTYKYLDVARGLALLLVMISHAHGLNRFLIYYYIQVFFIISGYTYRPGAWKFWGTIKKKAEASADPVLWIQRAAMVLLCADPRVRGGDEAVVVRRVFIRDSVSTRRRHTRTMFYLLDIANGAMWYLTAFFVTSLIFYLVADKCLSSWKICTVTSIVAAVADGAF